MSKLDKVHASIRPEMASLPDFASILVVDDQRFDRTRLRRLISTLEFDTHVVEADCLETMGTMLEADTFNLILLDYDLPDGTGLQALEAVRLSAKNRNAATIMVAGEGQTHIAIEALKRGCSDYITKDNLTQQSFRRASINALQKSRLSIGLETEDSKRRQIEAVLNRFSSECASEIKPVVSRMMRQLRDLRDSTNLSPSAITEHHQRIENSCMRLWDFLNDLEDYAGTDIANSSATSDVPRTQPGIDRADMHGADTAISGHIRDPFPIPTEKVRPERVKPEKQRKIFWRPDR